MTHTVAKALSFLVLVSLTLHLSGAASKAQSRYEADPIPFERKAINLQGFLGPFGEPYIPPELLASKDFKAVAESSKSIDSDSFFFPSIYFAISAKPNIHIKSKIPQAAVL